MSLWARESASRTEKPSSRSMAATALLPLAIPPVRPSLSIFSSARGGGRLRGRKFGRGAAEARGFDRVAHEHGDGHGADTTGDRGECARNVDGAGMNVADEAAAFGAEFFEAFGKILEEAFGLLGIGDAVGAH